MSLPQRHAFFVVQGWFGPQSAGSESVLFEPGNQSSPIPANTASVAGSKVLF